jgi:SAM-dependent methyltransferase
MREDLLFQDITSFILDPQNQPRFDFANGALYRSYGWLRDPANTPTFVRRLARLLRPVWHRRHELRFLDVGCGFGFAVMALAAYGARAARGVETAPECFKTCQEIQAAFPDVPAQFLTGRAEALPVEDSSVDVVLLIEAISHFVKPWEFLAEAWRVLAPGGVLIIADDNNKVNLWQQRELEDVWERFENGPPTENVHGHRVLKPYVERRREILAAHFPQGTSEDLVRLSQGTSGLWGDALLEAGRRYFAHGEIPQRLYHRGVCPVEPFSGVFIENLLDPREIGARLRQWGAVVEVRPYFGGESHGGTVWLLDALIHKTVPTTLGLRLAAGFRVYAKKPANFSPKPAARPHRPHPSADPHATPGARQAGPAASAPTGQSTERGLLRGTGARTS